MEGPTKSRFGFISVLTFIMLIVVIASILIMRAAFKDAINDLGSRLQAQEAESYAVEQSVNAVLPMPKLVKASEVSGAVQLVELEPIPSPQPEITPPLRPTPQLELPPPNVIPQLTNSQRTMLTDFAAKYDWELTFGEYGETAYNSYYGDMGYRLACFSRAATLGLYDQKIVLDLPTSTGEKGEDIMPYRPSSWLRGPGFYEAVELDLDGTFVVKYQSTYDSLEQALKNPLASPLSDGPSAYPGVFSTDYGVSVFDSPHFRVNWDNRLCYIFRDNSDTPLREVTFVELGVNYTDEAVSPEDMRRLLAAHRQIAEDQEADLTAYHVLDERIFELCVAGAVITSANAESVIMRYEGEAFGPVYAGLDLAKKQITVADLPLTHDDRQSLTATLDGESYLDEFFALAFAIS